MKSIFSMPPNARPCCGRSDACGSRLPVGGGRNGARRGYRRGGSRRRRLLPVDRLGPCGAGDRGRLSLYRLHVGKIPRHLSTEHYFTFSDKFRKEYLPYTIELGRSFVQPSYQSRGNSKSIYALDNLWDGLGAACGAESQGEIPFRQGDDVRFVQGYGTQCLDLVPAPLLSRSRSSGGR